MTMELREWRALAAGWAVAAVTAIVLGATWRVPAAAIVVSALTWKVWR